MSDWSRREVLRALRIGATAPLVTPLLAACGGAGRRRIAGPGGPRSVEQLRAQLRDVVVDLSRDYADVTAHAQLRRRGGAAVNASERGADLHRESALVLAVSSSGERFEQATTDLSTDGVGRAVAWLRARAPRDPAAREASLAGPESLAMPMARDPMAEPARQWLDRVGELYRRGLRVGGSRIVYRGAYLTIDDCTSLHLGRGHDRSQRIVRTRAGLLLVAWTGSAPSADEATGAGTIGLEALELSTGELERAADRALAQLTARAAPEGAMQVVLDPGVTGMLAVDGIAPVLLATAWHARESSARPGQLIGSSEITLADDPTLAGGYGSYYFDADGDDAANAVLIEHGGVVSPISDRASAAALTLRTTANGRRRTATGAIAPTPSNLAMAPGSRSLDQLLAGVDDGLIAEGPVAVQLDPRSWRMVIRAARGRGVNRGKLTGARYGPLEIRASLGPLLADAAVSGGPLRYQPRQRGDLALSSAGPYLLSRGEVRRG